MKTFHSNSNADVLRFEVFNIFVKELIDFLKIIVIQSLNKLTIKSTPLENENAIKFDCS
jgi:hypothetical protein